MRRFIILKLTKYRYDYHVKEDGAGGTFGNNKGCWEVLSPTRKETDYSDRRFWVSYILFI